VKQKVISWKELPKGCQPIVTLEEYELIENIIKKDENFVAAMKKRNLTNPDHWMIEPWTFGYYGDESYKGKRLLRSLVYTRLDWNDDNGYAHPVEGLSIHIDLTNAKIVKIIDNDEEVQQKKFNYKQELLLKHQEGYKIRENFKPIEVIQPEGPSWSVNGNEVEWQNWKFRVVFTTLEGLVLQNITFKDRPICYRASIAEMVVPYGSPEDIHCFKNVFDAGFVFIFVKTF
jgi:primary-amine oxidase